MANGNTPVYSGLGARRGISAAGQSYLKTIKEAGETISGLGTGLANVQMEIGRREAEARSKIKESNAATQGGTNAEFLQEDANNMKALIGGEAENSYDFSNVNDIARFTKDVENLNYLIKITEESHSRRVGSDEDELGANSLNALTRRTILSQDSGGATEGYVYENLAGEGDFYDAKSSNMEAAERAVKIFDGSKIIKNDADGTYTLQVDGEDDKKFKTYEELLEYQQESVQPEYKRMPEVSGARYVQDESIGPNKYETQEQAASAYFNEVISPRVKNIALRHAQTKTGTRTKQATMISEKSKSELADKYGFTAQDDFTEEQYEFFKEMMQQWRDEKKSEKTTGSKKSSGAGGASDLLTLSPSYREFTSYTDQSIDAQGRPSGAESTGGSATISLGKDLPIRLELMDQKISAIEGVREVKVRTIGYDADGPFGIGTFKDADGKERSVRVPLPADPYGVVPGGLLDEIKQEFDMSPAQYKSLMGNLYNSWDRRFGRGQSQ